MESILFYVPLAIGVLGNILYNIFAKSTPENANTFASLTLTYAAGMAATFILYMVTSGGGNIVAEFAKANWASYALGLCIVGCDVAIILLYRAGWDLSVGTLVGNISLSLCLAVIGVIFWHESLGPIKIVGILVCIAGLYIVNRPEKTTVGSAEQAQPQSAESEV
ncbi:EamA family transporter [Collinsella provencensis]|uniref:EamA family transporter n=1 Tax=Collinsella provencensis TaxID=1937461 RepID=UPI000C83A478|nr:EamA family transporter [Collinsella provencensis]